MYKKLNERLSVNSNFNYKNFPGESHKLYLYYKNKTKQNNFKFSFLISDS